MSQNKGKYKLILEGSKEAFEYLQALFKSGELSKSLGVDVRAISIIQPDASAFQKPEPEAFIENETIRQSKVVATKWVNLSQWLENVFESDWQPLENLLSSITTPAGNFQSPVRFLNKTPEELIRIIQTMHKEKERWQALESLWQHDPNNPAIKIRTKARDPSMLLAGHGIGLIVGVLKKSDREVVVFVRVFLMNGETQLPPGLELIITDKAGYSGSAVAKKGIYIQRSFTAALGEKFSVKVALGNASIEEHFIC